MAPPEYVQIVGQAQPACVTAPLPVVWLEGDVLAEYVQFLKEAEEAAAPPLPGVKWLKGDVLAEYVQFLKEAEEAAQLPGVKWLEGDVLANFLQFLAEDEQVVHYGSGNSSSGSNGGDFMCEEDQDDEEEEMDDDDGVMADGDLRDHSCDVVNATEALVHVRANGSAADDVSFEVWRLVGMAGQRHPPTFIKIQQNHLLLMFGGDEGRSMRHDVVLLGAPRGWPGWLDNRHLLVTDDSWINV
ncbi:hypothetical protein VPH35_123052 [Triticum aestivum]